MGERPVTVNQRIAEALERLHFEHRETDFRHHGYDEEIYQYELIQRGDLRALEVGKTLFEGPTTGSLSDDPVKNYQFLFVASITLACRFCIEGGMPPETAYNLSDLYIRQVEKCASVEAIFALHDTMFRDYATRMQTLRRKDLYSRPVSRCLDYIEQHLQQPLSLRGLSDALGVSASYLSTLFKRETGVAVSEYIRRKRIDTARVLLQYTEFSCMEISEYLCFSSDAHFSQLFHRYVGLTPGEYRKQKFRRHWEGRAGKA